MSLAAVLMYHHVGDEAGVPWVVSPAQLRDHVIGLREAGYQSGDLAALFGGVERLAVVTFDDAYADVHRHALPVLADLGVPATVFVPVAYVGGTDAFACVAPWGASAGSRILSWTELSELQQAGWSIQSHGWSHLPYSRMKRLHVEDELRRSRAAIEDRLGTPVFAHAYPYGVVPDRTKVAHRGDLLAAEWLVETIPFQVADVEHIANAWRPDVIVCDVTMWGPILVTMQRCGIPVAVLSMAAGCTLPVRRRRCGRSGWDRPPAGSRGRGRS